MPAPRGTTSAALITMLCAAPGRLAAPAGLRPVWSDDLQLALRICYELHFGGFDEVDDDWAWHPSLLAFRAALETRWEGALRELPCHGDLAARLAGATAGRHRGDGRLRALLMEIDAYGAGQQDRVYSALVATMVRDEMSAATLVLGNALGLFGLHRRLLGALVGYLAAIEATSADPHEQIAALDLCRSFMAKHPGQAADVLFGAVVYQELGARSPTRWLPVHDTANVGS